MESEKIEMLQNELNAVFTTLQKLDAPMTENNVVIMNSCLGSLKFIYKELGTVKEDVQDGTDAE